MGRTYVVERDLGWGHMRAVFRAAQGRHVDIGYLEGDRHDAEKGAPATLATIAAVQEHGIDMIATERQAAFMRGELGMGGVRAGSRIRIPARKVWGPTLDVHGPKMQALAGRLLDECIAGRLSVDQALGQIGESTQGALKLGYRRAKVAPLSPVTIAQRKKRSRGSSKPLIDTAQLVNGIRWRLNPARQSGAWRPLGPLFAQRLPSTAPRGPS